ncbi:hypothetical protein GCM10017784_40860 [Deinococcus indicus]|nr:hypothetical protein [Deinococcus indicus]GHG41784.1 hypothetical protein GCM10017784_40860 [Deinococcus indicus]
MNDVTAAALFLAAWVTGLSLLLAWAISILLTLVWRDREKP